MLYCPYCRAQVAKDTKFCSSCGKEIPTNAVNMNPEPTIQNEIPTIAPAEIKTHLVGAILTSLFCCLPFGITSIVFAAKVYSQKEKGDYVKAMEYSEKAEKWVYRSVIAGVIWVILWFIGMLIKMNRY